MKFPVTARGVPAQAAFLREALLQDADWAELADQLSNALRAPESAAPC
jgi:hypothetical protein